ncbi:MAG: hypothetical protein B7Z66_13880 [Chromatiales bacterium 21-64-14]|nr:MAG: hypothetical protein B7Z66_13880 [Chromatiales bacterium 21-64-14]HQU15016.1 SGNH/GDSL hydrolase family protein [Gammaproteobacteria bacterium]
MDLTAPLLFLLKLTTLLVVLGATLWWVLARRGGHRRARAAFGSILLTVTATLVALGAAEAITRYAYRGVITTGDDRSYFSHRWMRTDVGPLNRMGFRERNFNLTPAPGVYRIAVIGDSFTWGQGIRDDQRLTNLLQAQLDTHGARFQVLNFAQPGAQTDDEVRILRESALKAHPDYILLQWFINDPEGHNFSGRPWTYRLLPSDVLNSYLYSHSAFYFLVDQQWNLLQQKLGMGAGYSYDQYMVRRFRDPNGKDSVAAQRELERFLDICRRHGVPVGIILFPELTSNLLHGYPLGFLMDRVLALCRARGIPCVDLRPVYAGRPPAELHVDRFDGHPSALANRLAERAVYAAFAPDWTRLAQHPTLTSPASASGVRGSALHSAVQ